MAVRTQSPEKDNILRHFLAFIFYPEDEGSIFLSNFGGLPTRPLHKYQCDTLKFHKNEPMSKHNNSFTAKQQVMKETHHRLKLLIIDAIYTTNFHTSKL